MQIRDKRKNTKKMKGIFSKIEINLISLQLYYFFTSLLAKLVFNFVKLF